MRKIISQAEQEWTRNTTFICIEDPLRTEAAARSARCGIGKIVMMTGDSERTARAIAEKVGVDEYYSEVLPEDKERFVEPERRNTALILLGVGGFFAARILDAAAQYINACNQYEKYSGFVATVQPVQVHGGKSCFSHAPKRTGCIFSLPHSFPV